MLSGLISAWRILAFFNNFKARNSCWLYDLTAFTCKPTSFPYFFKTCKERKKSDVSGHHGGDSRERCLLRCAAWYSLVEQDYLAGCVQYYTFLTLDIIVYLQQYWCGTECCTFTLFLSRYYAIKCSFLTLATTRLSTFLCWYKRLTCWTLQSTNSATTAQTQMRCSHMYTMET